MSAFAQENLAVPPSELISSFEVFFLASLFRNNTLEVIDKKYGSTTAKTEEQLFLESNDVWNAHCVHFLRQFPQFLSDSIVAELKGRATQTPINDVPQHHSGPSFDSSTTIRLLHIHPAEDPSSAIKCDIEWVSLDQNPIPFYEVLHLVSENAGEYEKIQIAGRDMSVTRTLESALRQLRAKERIRSLWVGELCVTDRNMPEYLQAMKHFRLVRKIAQRETIWIGDESPTTKEGMRFVRELGETLSSEREDVSHMAIFFSLVSDVSRRSWEAFRELLGKPGFSCIDVLHCYIATDVTDKTVVQCGTEHVLYRSFYQVCSLIPPPTRLGYFIPDYPAWFQNVATDVHRRIKNLDEDPVTTYDSPVTLSEAIATGLEYMFTEPSELAFWVFGSPQDLHRVTVLMYVLSMSLAAYQTYEKKVRTLEHANQSQFDMALEMARVLQLNATELGAILELARETGAQMDDKNEDVGTGVPGISQPDTGIVVFWLRVFRALATRRLYAAESADILARAILIQEHQNLDLASLKAPSNTLSDTSFTYRYESLRSEPNTYDVRLLLLYPSADASADIHCDLIKVDLGCFLSLDLKHFPYVALSYIWGDSNPPRTIFLRGSRKSVTPNLFTALRHLRRPTHISVLWVDALCIDQDNAKEKESQIPLMGLLYSKAASVLMWLEDDEAEGRPALESLVHLQDPSKTLLGRMESDSRIGALAHKTTRFGISHQGLPALGKLMRSPYWSRVWIVQEVVLAVNSPIICIGSYAAALSPLIRMFKSGQYIVGPGSAFNDYDSQAPIRQLIEAYEKRNRPQSISLVTLFDGLLLTRGRFAKISHDYVLGILGIVDLQGESIEPDYGAPLFSLFRKAFEIILRQEGNLDVLSACNMASGLPHRDGSAEPSSMARCNKGRLWPSWLPDWSFKPSTTIQQPERAAPWSILLNPEGRGKYNATRGAEPMTNFLDDEYLMSAHGITVDTVRVASAQTWPEDIQSDWALFSQHAYKRNVYGSVEERWRAFQQLAVFAQFDEDDDNERGETSFMSVHFQFPFGNAKEVDDGIRLSLEPNSSNLGDPVSDHVEYGQASPYPNSNEQGMSEINTIQPSSSNGNGEQDDAVKMIPRDSEKKSPSRFRADKDMFVSGASCATYYSRFFITSEGHIGRGPVSMEPGDQVILLLGAKVPFVVRQNDVTKAFVLIGECYIQGLMQGEAIPDSELVTTEFVFE
ncbi:heterokaryon incompatibility protein-domain-containing protein [Nemania abortiva]|nr:heterokaryon incompatibility protein-domain-containing protein [Nemania abortiva]